MKILYAAGRSSSSKYQLSRFADNIPAHHTLKIAAYKSSSPSNLSIDFTLDFLLNPIKKSVNYYDNENFSIYYEIVKKFKPDLIISDLEEITSVVATELNIKLIQCSSNLLSFALTSSEMYSLGTTSKYKKIFCNTDDLSRAQNIIINSDENYVYSHFGDADFPPQLKSKFKWISPYHQVGKVSSICRHEAMGIMDLNTPPIINHLSAFKDVVLFNNDVAFDYENIKVKHIENEKEYYCNLKNSDMIVCNANATFLADAFYNGKFPIFHTDHFEKDSLINSLGTLKFKLGTSLQDVIDERDMRVFERQEHIRKNLFLHEIL